MKRGFAAKSDIGIGLGKSDIRSRSRSSSRSGLRSSIISGLRNGFLFTFSFLILTGTSRADPIFRINDGNNQVISKFGTCKNVINNSGKDLMVPTNTSGEWSAFLAGLPSGVTTNSTGCCTPGTQTYTSGSGNFIVPTNCTSLTIEIWGKGGGYVSGPPPMFCGARGGAGAGGYASKTIAVTGGQSIAYTVGTGTTATTSSGMTAYYGTRSTTSAGGTGGSASGGTVNISGGNGSPAVGNLGGKGGDSPNGGTGGDGGDWDTYTSGMPGNAPGGGAGGEGGDGMSCTMIDVGGSAQVKFTYN